MIKSKIPFLALLVLAFWGCSKDDDNSVTSEFVVAFENPSLSFSNGETEREIKLVFSGAATQNGMLQLVFDLTNMDYGTDFTTTPSAIDGVIEIPITAGSSGTTFLFDKLTPNPTEGKPEKSVEFSIAEVGLPGGKTQGNTTILVSYSENASLGGSFAPSVGGPNEPNQVYVDLSAQTETAIRRDVWDLAFYSGENFRVKLNASLYMMAAELQTTDIDAVTPNDAASLQPQMAFTVAGSNEFVDHPSGDIAKTVIAEISATPEENKVYLLKMGNEIGTDTPNPESVAVAGEERGWMKIRVLREGDNYILQYADLNSTTHKEVSISKSPGFNFTFFSLVNEKVANVEPVKENWDLCFTVFTEVEELNSKGELTAYGYSDYVKTNVLAQTQAYRVSTDDFSYDEFSIENLSEGNFEIDQQTIGSSWRNVIPPDRILFNDIFYVLKDSAGNIYKLRFTALMDENGERGHPEFEYELL
jgi:hypothetical protein